MSLRGRQIEERATLPDGREALVRLGVPDDPYVPRSERSTVALDLLVDDRLEATFTTAFDVDQESEALALARDIAARLASGALQPPPRARAPPAPPRHQITRRPRAAERVAGIEPA